MAHARSKQANRELVEQFLVWMRDDKGCQPASVYDYASRLERFLDFAGPLPLNNVKVGVLRAWVNRPKSGRAHGTIGKPATRSKDVAVLRSLFNYLHASELVERNPTVLLVAPKVHNRNPKPIPEDIWIRLWNSSTLTSDARVVLGLGFFVGLRREEIVRLSPAHFIVPPRMLIGFTRKGGGDDVTDRDARFSGTASGEHKTTFGYDADGNTTSIVAYLDGSPIPAASTTASYTSAGQMATWTETIAGIAKDGAYGWDQDGTLTSRTIAGVTETYFHDLRGLEIGGLPHGGGSFGRTYNGNGALASLQFANGVTTTIAYDLADRPTDRIAKRPDGTTLAAWEHVAYDDDDNRLSELVNQRQADGTTRTGVGEYHYDQLNRLDVAKEPFDTLVVPYILDDAGNVITEMNSVFTYTANRLTTRTNVLPTLVPGPFAPMPQFDTSTYSYDHYGNRSREDRLGNVATTTYDAASHTANFNGLGGATSVNYTYDGLDRMAKRFDSTNTTTLFFHDGLSGQVALETDAAGAVQTRYILDSTSEALGRVDNENPATRTWHVTDERGNLAALVKNTTADVDATFAYDAFGKDRPDLASTNGATSPAQIPTQPTGPNN